MAILDLNVNMKAFNQNKAMEHLIIGIFEGNIEEYKKAIHYMKWAKLYSSPQLP